MMAVGVDTVVDCWCWVNTVDVFGYFQSTVFPRSAPCQWSVTSFAWLCLVIIFTIFSTVYLPFFNGIFTIFQRYLYNFSTVFLQFFNGIFTIAHNNECQLLNEISWTFYGSSGKASLVGTLTHLKFSFIFAIYFDHPTTEQRWNCILQCWTFRSFDKIYV